MPYLVYKFKMVFVTKVEWSGGAGEDAPDEDVTFVYGAMSINYQQQNSSGPARRRGLGVRVEPGHQPAHAWKSRASDADRRRTAGRDEAAAPLPIGGRGRSAVAPRPLVRLPDTGVGRTWTRAPVDIFLELKDEDNKPIAGETVDADFSARDAIEIIEFSFDGDSVESRSTSDDDDDDDDDEAVQAGGGQEKPKKKKKKKSGPLCKFEISKIVDKSSTFLLRAYLEGVASVAPVTDAQFSSATITVRKSGKGQNKFLILKFGEVSVISYSLDVKSETPEEKVVFKFMSIQMKYYPQLPDGSLDTQMCETDWDFDRAEDDDD